MADLTITASSVATSSGSVTSGFLAGATITAGQSVYLKSSDSKWYLAQNDGTAEESGSGVRFGISLHAALSGQPLAVQESGVINVGSTLTVGTIYIVAATVGGIAPFADLSGTNNRIVTLGFGSTSALLDMSIKKNFGVSVP